MQDYYQLDQQNIFFLYKIKGLYAGLSFSSCFHLFVSLHFYLLIFLFYKSHVCCLFQALCKLGFICPLCYLYLALPPQISVYVCSSVFPCLKYTSFFYLVTIKSSVKISILILFSPGMLRNSRAYFLLVIFYKSLYHCGVPSLYPLFTLLLIHTNFSCSLFSKDMICIFLFLIVICSIPFPPSNI